MECIFLQRAQLKRDPLGGTIGWSAMSEFFSPDFVKFFLPLAGAVVAWFVNERRRRQWEEYKRKEEHYQELIGALKGFYADTPNVAARQAFLDPRSISAGCTALMTSFGRSMTFLTP